MPAPVSAGLPDGWLVYREKYGFPQANSFEARYLRGVVLFHVTVFYGRRGDHFLIKQRYCPGTPYCGGGKKKKEEYARKCCSWRIKNKVIIRVWGNRYS